MNVRFDHSRYYWTQSAGQRSARSVKELSEQEARDALCAAIELIVHVKKQINNANSLFDQAGF